MYEVVGFSEFKEFQSVNLIQYLF